MVIFHLNPSASVACLSRSMPSSWALFFPVRLKMTPLVSCLTPLLLEKGCTVLFIGKKRGWTHVFSLLLYLEQCLAGEVKLWFQLSPLLPFYSLLQPRQLLHNCLSAYLNMKKQHFAIFSVHLLKQKKQSLFAWF